MTAAALDPRTAAPADDLFTVLEREGLVGLQYVQRRLQVARATPTRWINDGVRLPSGAVVKLEAVRVGSRLLTSWAAVRRFIAATSKATPPRGGEGVTSNEMN